MTIPLKPHDPLIMWPTCCYVIIRKSFLSTISKLMGSKPGKVLIYYGRNFSTKILKLLSTSGLVQISPSLFDLCCKNVHSKQDFGISFVFVRVAGDQRFVVVHAEMRFQLYWNRISAWVFFCKFAAYFQNTFSQEHLWMAASESFLY